MGFFNSEYQKAPLKSAAIHDSLKFQYGIVKATKKLYGANYMTKQLDEYLTYDLGCAAALISAGFELVSLNKTNPRKVLFIFRGGVEVKTAVDNYWADRLEIKARRFFDNIKMLKNRIYSE